MNWQNSDSGKLNDKWPSFFQQVKLQWRGKNKLENQWIENNWNAMLYTLKFWFKEIGTPKRLDMTKEVGTPKIALILNNFLIVCGKV